MLEIDLTKLYNRNDILFLLDFTPEKLVLAEKRGLIKFPPNTSGMYGIFFFQCLKQNYKKFEEIHEHN